MAKMIPDEMMCPAVVECEPPMPVRVPAPGPRATEIMLDIETLSTANNAVVLSIGALGFQIEKEAPKVIASRLWVLDLHSQIAAGRDISAGTMKFWREQTKSARAHWAEDKPQDVTEVLVSLGGFIGESLVWANGSCFDIGILTSLHEQWSMGVPWKYNAVRDARTIYKATPKLRDRPTDLNLGPEHDPVADCISQVWGLWEHRAETDL